MNNIIQKSRLLLLMVAMMTLSFTKVSAQASGVPAGQGNFSVTITSASTSCKLPIRDGFSNNDSVFIIGNFATNPWQAADGDRYMDDYSTQGNNYWVLFNLDYPADFQFKFLIRYENPDGSQYDIIVPDTAIIFDGSTFNYQITICEPSGPDTLDYLHFVSLKGGDTVRFDKSGYLGAQLPDLQLEYSTDNRQNWHNYSWNDRAGDTIALTNVGDTVWFRAGQDGTAGTNATMSEASDKYYNFVFGKNDSIAAGGNIMSLYDGSCQQDSMTKYGFLSLFHKCHALTTAPSLPATKMATDCYYYMFRECSSLTAAPLLPATQLDSACYAYMFYQCTSLTTAPSLPATQLTAYCYYYMFNRCTSLTTAPSLPATQLATSCYNNMFSDCTSLTTAPSLSATQLESNCYGNMFSKCTSLVNAPSLQATKLAPYCYQTMFYGCSSLRIDTCDGSCTGAMLIVPDTTQAPEDWNYEMFTGCQGDSAYTADYGIKLGGHYCICKAGFLVDVAANDTALGSVTGAGYYDNGDTVTITATAKEFCHFVGWSNGETDSVLTFVVEGDTSITAVFARDTFFVYVNVVGAGTVTGLGLYEHGDSVVLTATAGDGYQFKNWSTGDTTAVLAFVMEPHDTTLTATFVSITAVDQTGAENYVAYVMSNDIVVAGATGHAVAIFDMNGKLVGKVENAAEIERIAVNTAGVYIIRVENMTATRVVVK